MKRLRNQRLDSVNPIFYLLVFYLFISFILLELSHSLSLLTLPPSPPLSPTPQFLNKSWSKAILQDSWENNC